LALLGAKTTSQPSLVAQQFVEAYSQAAQALIVKSD
jgi:hypothetical protein